METTQSHCTVRDQRTGLPSHSSSPRGRGKKKSGFDESSAVHSHCPFSPRPLSPSSRQSNQNQHMDENKLIDVIKIVDIEAHQEDVNRSTSNGTNHQARSLSCSASARTAKSIRCLEMLHVLMQSLYPDDECSTVILLVSMRTQTPKLPVACS